MAAEAGIDRIKMSSMIIGQEKGRGTGIEEIRLQIIPNFSCIRIGFAKAGKVVFPITGMRRHIRFLEMNEHHSWMIG